MSEFKGSQNYVASDELMRAVNIAMALQKPLLIKGEPGTGKTKLAEAISEALGKKLIIWRSSPPPRPRTAYTSTTWCSVCMTASSATTAWTTLKSM